MDTELLKTVLGSSGITILVGTVITLAAQLWKNHKEGSRAEDLDDAEWNAAFKAGAERHVLGYDVPMHHAMLDLQYEINKVRSQIGEEPKQFAALPDPRDFPLFPSRGKDKP